MALNEQNAITDPVDTDGSTTTFPYNFRITSSDHIKVYRIDKTTRVPTELSPSSYSLTGVGADGGGDVVISPALATGYEIQSARANPYEQETVLKRKGHWNPADIEWQFDVFVMQIQQLASLIDRRVLQLPVGASDTPGEFVATLLEIVSILESSGYGTLENQYSKSLGTVSAGSTASGSIAATTGPAGQRGVVHLVQVTASGSSGAITLTVYQDAAKTQAVYQAVIDQANQVDDNLPWYFEADDSTGTLYYDLTNGTASDTVVSLVLKAQVMATQNYTPELSSLGDGLKLLSGEPTLDLSGDFSFEGSKLAIKPDTSTPARLVRNAGGVGIEGAVATTTDQTIQGRKEFASLAVTQATTSGPPTTGSWTAGQFYLDTDGLMWLCRAGGTPGTWALHGSADGEATASITSVTAATAWEFTLATASSEGELIRARVACPFAVGADDTIPFRVILHSNTDRDGRDACGPEYYGAVRCSYLTTAIAAGNNTLSVNDTYQFEVDDLVLLENASGQIDIGKIVTTDAGAGTITLDEPLQYDHGSGRGVSTVAEMPRIPFWNDDGNPTNRRKAICTVENDHASTAAPFLFLARYRCGGGA
ncbi:MAG: hypothetical protein ACOC00_00110 [Halothiobacillaceae bacterium]